MLLQTVKRQPLRIECARVGGVEIPNQKRIEYSLQYIFGVGHTTAKAILVETVSLCFCITAQLCCDTACPQSACLGTASLWVLTVLMGCCDRVSRA